MKYETVVKLTNEILNEYDTATIRQIYYRLVSPPYQYMSNNRSMYNSFDKMMVRARNDKDIDWRKIVDHARTTIKPVNSFDTVSEFIDNAKYNWLNWWDRYHVNIWNNQPKIVKVFVEKDALAGVVSDVASNLRVDVIAGKGYNSVSQLMLCAEDLNGIDKPVMLLYFGDFDPSGLDIDRSAIDRISGYCFVDVKMVRISLTENDIVDLPYNPVKLADTRADKYLKQYGNRCWELDALPPDVLRNKVRDAIITNIDYVKFTQDIERENKERQNINGRLNTELEKINWNKIRG